ncbi:unnamed protein product [Rotaria sp. Silwood2]|nr:unnamed protein product [Rotaria sp. Silwood2]CAF3991327.1 unnamed protein product [Rotaria sp. Silwood2]
MHATKLANIGIKYLGDLQLDDLYQLQDELNTLWKNGQSTISNNLYDKIVDSINYEITQLKNDPYNYAVTKTDNELKKLIDYLTNLHSRGQSPIENSIWDILNHELTMRNTINFNSSLAHPSHWTTMSLSENPIQFIKLCRSSQEFQDISNFFSKSLQKSSTVIYSIIRIQNLRLWNIFQELQKIIPNNIQRLFHGTASISHQKLIMYHGFYHSFCPGGLIGDGVYFAVNANYSNNDSYVLKKTNHRRELFICQVLLGNSSQGGSGVKSPAQGCHSVFHHNNTRNDMFCIFNSYQAYPEYIVQYDYE